MNGGYGSTGYAPNPEANLQDIILNIIQNILSSFCGRGTCTMEIAAEVYNRCCNNIYNITNNIASRFVDNTGCCNTEQIQNYLANYDIPAIMRDVQNQFINARNNNGFNQPMFGNAGFSNYNNNSWNRPQPIYNNFSNNGMFGQQPSMMSSGAVSSAHGFGKAIMNQTGNSFGNTNNTTIANSAPNNPNININPFLPNTKNTYNNIKPVETKEDTALIDKFSKIFKDRETRRRNKISINKITTDTDSIVYNKDFVNNHLCTEELAVLRGNRNFNDTKKVENIESIAIDSPEYCEIGNAVDITYNGSVINSSNYDLSVPVVNTKEAIDLVKEAVPNLTDQEQWIANIQYKELVVKKLPSFGSEAKDAFRAINDKLGNINTLKDISNIIIPVFKKQITEVREYLETLVIDRVNDLFRTSLYLPDNPSAYPTVKSWNGIFQLVDEANKEENDYVSYMFERLGDEYVNRVFLCVKSALIDIFEDDGDGTEVVVDTENNGCSLLAKLSEITCIAGKYRFCDYGHAPVSHMESLTKQFNRDYLVHKLNQMVLVTNIDIDAMLGTVATNTVVDVIGNLPQHVIYHLLGGLRRHGINRDMTLIEMDKKGEYINKVFRINLSVDDKLFITRE